MRRLLVALVIVVVALVGGIGIARLTSPSVDGIGCDFSEGSGYHIHALLTIIDHGRSMHPPAGVGFQYLHLCLYWIHTHDNTGVIHIEAPHSFKPTLRNFFDVWGEPLTTHQIWRYPVSSPSAMRVFLDRRRYGGNPGGIRLREHTAVTLEIGPPFVSPPLPNFHGL